MSRIVELRDIKKSFDYYTVLSGIHLQVDKGQVVWLEGANGCGKTTLLRIIATLLPPTAGHIEYFSNKTVDKIGARQHITALFDNLGLVDELSVAENLRFFSKVSGQQENSSYDFGIDPQDERTVRTLSSGTRKRLGLTLAFNKPSTLALLDEPFDNLDTNGKQLAMNAIKQYKKAGGGVVIVSHSQEFKSELADQAAVLSNGKLHFESPA